MKSGILMMMMMMMCCRKLSLLPHSDDVLGIVSTCLPVATLSLCVACTLSLEQITLLRGESQHQAGLQARAPCRAYVGSGGK